jgi:anti-sigma regulatory factor (Ser/Thr protein kinase)
MQATSSVRETESYNHFHPTGVQNIVGESLTLEVRNSRDAIAPASAQAEVWLARNQSSPQMLSLVLLAIEELVTNCIKYGYEDAREHTITVVLSIAEKELTMNVVDDGRPFNPLAAPTPDLCIDIEDRAIGGLGIHLLRRLADHMIYERRDGTNQLTLTKRMP